MTPGSRWPELYRTEDWWAIWFSVPLLALAATGVTIPQVASWEVNPLAALSLQLGSRLAVLAAGLAVLTGLGMFAMRQDWRRYLAGFGVVFSLAVVAFLFAQHKTMKHWGIEYAIWALGFGLLVANTVGTPDWLRQGARSEMLIKTGLVLLGAEVLFSEVLDLGGPGLFVAWFVTPTVIVFMWYFGTRLLRMPSMTLTIVIAAATSVCGVSAAIATAAACRAKKEELTLAVGMTMIVTVAMMVAMPALARSLQMQAAVAGAWLGGTIDSTGAVIAAGALLGEHAEKVAAVVKMIQNVLIGLVAFVVAVVWVARIDRDPDAPRPSAMEIWHRFPKFILGFVLASLVFSFVLMPCLGDQGVGRILDHSKHLRGWLFCLAFVAIGLESNVRDLSRQLVGGKPILLYVVGQSFNILLTLLAAWLAFGGVLFAPR